MANDKNKINKDASIKKETLNQTQKEQISAQENREVKSILAEPETKLANSKNTSQSKRRQENLANAQEVSNNLQANKPADVRGNDLTNAAEQTIDKVEKNFDTKEKQVSKIEEDKQINVKNNNTQQQNDKSNLKTDIDSASKEKNAEETKDEKSKTELTAQIDAAKELISAARSAMAYGHFDTAASKLSQAMSILAGNPLLKGMESGIQNAQREMAETQSRYMSAQNNGVTGIGILSEEEAKKLHESLQASSINYYGSEEKKKEVTDARKKIVDGEDINPGALQMYANHCLDVDEKHAENHIKNASSMISHYQGKIEKGIATKEEIKACDKLIEDKSGIEIDLKVQEGFKDLTKKEIGKDDKESVRKHICGKCETEKGSEEVKEVVRKANKEQKAKQALGKDSKKTQSKTSNKSSFNALDALDEKENQSIDPKMDKSLNNFKKNCTTTYEKGGSLTPPHTPPKAPTPPGKNGPSK